jgi:hypothetical protein
MESTFAVPGSKPVRIKALPRKIEARVNAAASRRALEAQHTSAASNHRIALLISRCTMPGGV